MAVVTLRFVSSDSNFSRIHGSSSGYSICSCVSCVIFSPRESVKTEAPVGIPVGAWIAT